MFDVKDIDPNEVEHIESMDELLAPLGLTVEKIEELKKTQIKEMMSWFPKELHKTNFINDIYKLASNYYDRYLKNLITVNEDDDGITQIKDDINEIELNIYLCEELTKSLRKNFNSKKHGIVKNELIHMDSILIDSKSKLKVLTDSYNAIVAAKISSTEIQS